MDVAGSGPFGPDVRCCSYGSSRLVFRGPARALGGPRLIALGGAETFARGIARPWPAQLEEACGLAVVNLGAVGAGADAFLNDDTVMAACDGASGVVVQVPGAQALSNRFYRVHPRRNDRFIRATPALIALFPEVDFCEFSFTRHLLGALHRRDPARFSVVCGALQAAWTERMRALLARIAAPVILLWLSDHAPAERTGDAGRHLLRGEPLLVTRAMLDALGPTVAGVAEVVVAPTAGSARPALPGPAAHSAAASALAPLVQRLVGSHATEDLRVAARRSARKRAV